MSTELTVPLAVRPLHQLRGEAAVQVPEVRVSFVQGVGAFFAASGSLIFTNERP